jgi:Protein of unknown function (DUF2752)
MNWRRLRAGEIDHEVIWLGVSLASLALAWLWLRLGLPLPRCVFHDVTGCACPTCGATRCVRLAFGADFGAAFWINPLALCALGATAAYDVYAATVLALRLPRLRGDALPAWVGKGARIGAVTVIAVNWTWLLWRGV